MNYADISGNTLEWNLLNSTFVIKVLQEVTILLYTSKTLVKLLLIGMIWGPPNQQVYISFDLLFTLFLLWLIYTYILNNENNNKKSVYTNTADIVIQQGSQK
jgi:hypothetical protein